MISWKEFEKAAPEIAAAGLRLTNPNEVALLATVSAEGRPRIHPFVPKVVEGRLVAFILGGSPKKKDLDRTGYYTIHAQPGAEDEEFMVAGKARCIDEGKAFRGVAGQAMGFVTTLRDNEILYEFLIDRGLHTRWLDFGTADHRPERSVWTMEKGLTR